MKLLADEYCAAGLVEILRGEGHDVLYVAESFPGGNDGVILERPCAEERLLITEDKDFGELVYRLRKPEKGVILLRFAVDERNCKADRLCEVLVEQADRLPDAFVVIEKGKTRFRPLASID